MRTTAILNLKGGVGKTVTAINLASLLAYDYGQKVLVIDADAQHNTSDFFGVQKIETLTKMLKGQQLQSVVDVHCNNDAKSFAISVIPSDDALMELDLTKAADGTLDLHCIKDFTVLNSVNAETAYDYIIIDCPPAFSAASAAALIASDDVVIPMKIDAFSISGMANLNTQINAMKRINPRLKVAGILPTMWYRSDTIVDAEEMLPKAGLNVYHHIRRSPTVDRMTFSRVPLLQTTHRSGALEDYRAFVSQYMAQEVRHG